MIDNCRVKWTNLEYRAGMRLRAESALNSPSAHFLSMPFNFSLSTNITDSVSAEDSASWPGLALADCPSERDARTAAAAPERDANVTIC